MFLPAALEISMYRELWKNLAAAERLTVLCSAISIIAMLAMVLGFVLLFFSLGCVKMLSQSMSEFWAYVIVGGVYVVAGAIIIVARRCCYGFI